MSNHMKPSASIVCQQRSRMETLATPPALAASETDKELCLPERLESAGPSSPRWPRHRGESLTPSPPASESSRPDAAASGSQTPLTEASESSADSYANISSFLRRNRASAAATALKRSLVRPRHDHIRPTLASKRVLSEGDVILPRPSKKYRITADVSPRARSLALPSHADAIAAAFGSASTVETSARLPSVTSWRMARNQRRDRQRAKRGKVPAVRADDGSLPIASTSSGVTADARPAPAGATKPDVLPELRLLSATRTAPIGWSRFAGASSFVPHRVEVYDERDAKMAPERQRFWPIIDHQLDYTGARMLSLSDPSHSMQETQVQLAFEQPVSPKSGLPVQQGQGLLSIQPPVVVDSLSIGSSDEDHSPLTPGAPTRHSAARGSRLAREAVRNEAHRKPTISLSPAATLAAVIDFTRAQAASQPSSSPARNAYGQLVYSPPSPDVKPKHDLAAHAPLRIAPRRQLDGSANKGRDYFGHWETYLCNFGKESTF